jgi:hypothetical protein
MGVYFYDKAGVQIVRRADRKLEDARLPSARAGNIFAGAVNPNEKLTMTFSCMKKDMPAAGHDGAELQVVGSRIRRTRRTTSIGAIGSHAGQRPKRAGRSEVRRHRALRPFSGDVGSRTR